MYRQPESDCPASDAVSQADVAHSTDRRPTFDLPARASLECLRQCFQRLDLDLGARPKSESRDALQGCQRGKQKAACRLRRDFVSKTMLWSQASAWQQPGALVAQLQHLPGLQTPTGEWVMGSQSPATPQTVPNHGTCGV